MCMLSAGVSGNGIWAANQNGIQQTDLYLPPDENGDSLDPGLSGFYMFWTMVILLQVSLLKLVGTLDDNKHSLDCL